MEPTYADRVDAGRRLAQVLGIPDGDPVVVGVANGGVVVAAEVARELELPLDAAAVVKIGHPEQPEYAIGAVAPGVVVLRDRSGLPPPRSIPPWRPPSSGVASSTPRCTPTPRSARWAAAGSCWSTTAWRRAPR